MKYNIFISHAWDYNEDYYKLENWLDETIDWKNMSIPKHDAKEAKNDTELFQMIENNIKNSSIFLVIGGMYVPQSNRKWIQKEIEIAKRYGKYIIAIKPRGNQNIPKILQENTDIIVGWNSKSIIDAIKDYNYVR